MTDVSCVGALIRDERHRVYVHRRSPTRSVYPGIWDIVGGHLEAGESPEEALAREVAEETGWKLRHIEAVVADWKWEYGGRVRRELDYLIEVEGDLYSPVLEEGKHDAYAWVGPSELELLMEGRSDGDRRLRDIVAKTVRIRLTERLRLEPTSPAHADDLWTLHQDDAVAEWHGGRWTKEAAERRAKQWDEAWETDGAHQWMAYDRQANELVGRGGVSRMEVDGAERLEVGWTIRADLWGRGYATEIGRAGLDFAFDDLGSDEVVAFTEPHNKRSRAVMERLGMAYSHDIIHDGEPFVLYALSDRR